MDNNGDGSLADRPVVDGVVIPRNSGRGTPTYDVALFVEKRLHVSERVTATLRAEGFNVLNHANIYGRNGVYGNLTSGVPLPTLGQPLGGINNVEPGREFQFLLRIGF